MRIWESAHDISSRNIHLLHTYTHTHLYTFNVKARHTFKGHILVIVNHSFAYSIAAKQCCPEKRGLFMSGLVINWIYSAIHTSTHTHSQVQCHTNRFCIVESLYIDLYDCLTNKGYLCHKIYISTCFVARKFKTIFFSGFAECKVKEFQGLYIRISCFC